MRNFWATIFLLMSCVFLGVGFRSVEIGIGVYFLTLFWVTKKQKGA